MKLNQGDKVQVIKEKMTGMDVVKKTSHLPLMFTLQTNPESPAKFVTSFCLKNEFSIKAEFMIYSSEGLEIPRWYSDAVKKWSAEKQYPSLANLSIPHACITGPSTIQMMVPDMQ